MSILDDIGMNGAIFVKILYVPVQLHVGQGQNQAVPVTCCYNIPILQRYHAVTQLWRYICYTPDYTLYSTKASHHNRIEAQSDGAAEKSKLLVKLCPNSCIFVGVKKINTTLHSKSETASSNGIAALTLINAPYF